MTEATKEKVYRVLLDIGHENLVRCESYMNNGEFTAFYIDRGTYKERVAEFKTSRIISIIRKR